MTDNFVEISLKECASKQQVHDLKTEAESQNKKLRLVLRAGDFQRHGSSTTFSLENVKIKEPEALGYFDEIIVRVDERSGLILKGSS